MKSTDQTNTISIKTIILRIYKRLLWILLLTIPIIALSIYYISIQTKVYRSSSTIILHTSQGNNGMNTMAALAGINLGQQSTDISAYLADILLSRAVIEKVVDHTWHASVLSKDTVSRPLEYWWKVKIDSAKLDWKEIHRDAMIERLRRVKQPYIKYVVTKSAGMAQLVTEFEDPQLAYEINTFLLQELNDYVMDKNQTKSGRTRLFIESRLDEAHRDLAQAESRLFEFRTRNHQRDASTIQMEEQRLNLDYSINQELYISLRKQYEMARIEELKETQVLEILEPATQPRSPSNSSKSVLIVAAVFIALLWSILVILVLDFLWESWPSIKSFFKDSK